MLNGACHSCMLCLDKFGQAIWQDVCLVEWPERLGEQIASEESPHRLEVAFEGFGPQAEGRTATLRAVGSRWQGATFFNITKGKNGREPDMFM
eukprot:g29889.t1